MPTPLALQPETPASALRLAEFLISLSYLAQVPFVALLLAGTAVALVAGGLAQRRQDRDLLEVTKQTADLVLPDRRLLLLPAAAAVSLAGVELLYGPRFFSWVFWAALLGSLLTGLALVGCFRRRLGGPPGPFHLGSLAGVAGLLLCGSSYLLLFFGSALLQRPERWPLLDSQPLLLLSWSGTARFATLCCLGLLLVAAAWRSPEADVDRGREGGSVASGGRWVGLTALLLLVPLLLLDLVNLPPAAGTPLLFILYGLMVAVAGLGAVGLALGRGGGRGAVIAASLLLLLLVAADHAGRGQILTPQTLWAPEGWLQNGTLPSRGEAVPGGGDKEAVAGQDIFEKVCRSCHAFDRTVVGPSLNEVVPGYRGDIEGLKAFLRNPVKKNPDFPAMPDLDLTEEEIDAVSRYLLQQAGG